MTRPRLDQTHDPSRTSWVEGANGHRDFPIQNLPLGIFSPPDGDPRAGVAIGDFILDLRALADGFGADLVDLVSARTLNTLLARPTERTMLRQIIFGLLSDEANRSAVGPSLHVAEHCAIHLPAEIGDYSDFYVGIHHAMNVGRQFRPDNPLLANYKFVPIGYHGRASSVRPSGEPVVRPSGQRKLPDEDAPVFGASRRLDFELELGVWIGPGNPLGQPIPIGEASDHVAGLCLLNDWSARDVQAWEYQPLGPFLAKNFHTTISPWVVTAEALAPFRVAQPTRPSGDPVPLPYLEDNDDQASGAYAIELQASLVTAAMRQRGLPPHPLSRGAATSMYWTVAQIVAHHASNGCNLRPGDLLGTGTISGPDPGSLGSLLEITEGGRVPIALPGGETRGFLEDGDEVILSATARADGFVPIGFGDCRAVIVPALA